MQTRHDDVLTLELPYRERLRIRRTVLDGGGEPHVAVVSGIHGDELEGLYVCHRLAHRIEALVAEHPTAVRGRIDLYPALNPLGLDALQRSVPTHEIDLNRSFPGHSDGLFAQRIAAAVMRSLAGAALVVDVHASNVFLREIPQVRVATEFSRGLLPLARAMNVDVVWVNDAITVLETTVAHSLNQRGVPCLVVEMGVGMRVTPDYCDQVVTGILGLWRTLGVLDPSLRLPGATHHPLLADASNVHYVNATTSGLFVPSSAHWTTVHEGQLLGHIVSPHSAEVLAEVRAPATGVLFTLREYPLVYEGSLMARLLATR